MRCRGFRRGFMVCLPVVFLTLSSPIQAQGPRDEGHPLAEGQRDLQDPSPDVRRQAVKALGSFGPQAVPALIQALQDPHDTVQQAAQEAIRKIGPAAVPALVQALKDATAEVRGLSAFMLGEIGPAAKDAVPALTEALEDADWAVRFNAQEALRKIEGR